MRSLQFVDRINRRWAAPAIGTALVRLMSLGAMRPVWAHHAMGGRVPANGFEGLIAGLAHPVIGIDHLAFVVASGLLAAALVLGWFIPLGFTIAAIIGTGLHVQGVNLPLPEVGVAASVVLFGAAIVMERRQVFAGKMFYTIALSALAVFAGVFHGYAYGESIVGAGMTPLTAYLLGFTAIQLAIAMTVYFASRWAMVKLPANYAAIARSLGFGISAIGLAFLVSAIGA